MGETTATNKQNKQTNKSIYFVLKKDAHTVPSSCIVKHFIEFTKKNKKTLGLQTAPHLYDSRQRRETEGASFWAYSGIGIAGMIRIILPFQA